MNRVHSRENETIRNETVRIETIGEEFLNKGKEKVGKKLEENGAQEMISQ